MPRAIWKGSISFGLVNIPVKMYKATQDKKLSFTTLDKEGHPLQYKRWCPICNREVKWEEIKKGYKIEKDKYVILEKSDFEKVKLKTTKTIEIVGFVEAPQVDPIFYAKSYYLVPDETGIKAYSLFVEALRLSNKIAIGKVVLKNKEYLVAIRAYKKGLLLQVLHYLDEIIPQEELPELKNLVVVSEEELKLAQALIEKLTQKEVKWEEFKDTYSEALKKIILAKIEGKEIVEEEKKEEAEVKSLMEALKISLERVKKKKKEAE